MSLDFLLTYVEARGRAEPINLLLIDANVNFYDERIPIEEWQTRKREFKFGPVYGQPFHGLPTLEVQTFTGPFRLAGTYAILDYLDDTFSAHEGRDRLQKAKINMVRDVCMSFVLDFQELLRNDTWDDPEDRAAVHKSRILPFLLDLSRHISMNGLRKTFGADPNDPLTAAGACAFEALDVIELLFPSTLAEWPILAVLRQRIAARPRIRKYLESGHRCQQITMSPHETPQRIDIARNHPLVFEKKSCKAPEVPPETLCHALPLEKKKARQMPSHISAVTNDQDKYPSRSTDPDSEILSRPTTLVNEDTVSDSEGGRGRSQSKSSFFSKRSTKDPKHKTRENKDRTPRSSSRGDKSTKKDDRTMRSIRGDAASDASWPSQPAPELPPPMTAAQVYGSKVELSLTRKEGSRTTIHSNSERSLASSVTSGAKHNMF